MSEEFGLTNDGTGGVKQIPVEVKDHSKDPKLTETKRERTELEKQVDAELIAKGSDVINDFDETQEIVVSAKKRGRPKKVVVEQVESPKPAPRNWHCSSCKETFSDTTVMKIGAGTNRWAVFCPMCQRSFGFQDQVVLNTVAKLIRENPTGK